ncbi:DedA family protein [Diaminobutyricimonas sp. TR449]|uniref:DedA family protein n=1 Tax=Diaminobutyricimonas sp. TR449 TaxID=2708076 RepID=UPI00141EA609|nr:DedA family protein [Diaminobutyricimonas sp. TR449]
MNELLAWVLEMVDSVGPIMRTVLAGIGVMLETSVLIGLIIPGDSIVIVASLSTENPFVNPVSFIALVITVIVGSLIGESIGFALGRYFGPKIRRSALGRRIGEDHWMRAENYLDRRGGIAVFVSRFLPVLHSLVPLTVGMSTMSYRKFMAWTIPACTIWALAYVSVGTTAGEVTRQLISEQLHYAGYVFVGIIVVFAVIIWVVKSLLARSQRRHMLRRGDGDANTLEPAE